MAERKSQGACIVCDTRGNARSLPPARRSRVTIEARTMSLCRDHAGLVAIRMPRTWEDLRAIFRAPTDRRSPIPRRKAETEDRRVFPPRPEGRRAKAGRRKADQDA
jgi:hypothetical protein